MASYIHALTTGSISNRVDVSWGASTKVPSLKFAWDREFYVIYSEWKYYFLP